MAVVELIAATTTNTSLKVAGALDTRTYGTSIKVSDAKMTTLDTTDDASILNGTALSGLDQP